MQDLGEECDSVGLFCAGAMGWMGEVGFVLQNFLWWQIEADCGGFRQDWPRGSRALREGGDEWMMSEHSASY
jgi:hypothetical protein